MRKGRGCFIASTGQHVGKTTTCLGLVSGFKKRMDQVGFMKPIGQEHVELENGLHVDKDVVLFKEHFGLRTSYEEMSPVLMPSGFTRRYLDGEVDDVALAKKIEQSYQSIASQDILTVVEGTGHMGVGSIINLNNAAVARLLKLPVILVASGGLGSSFDALALNIALCVQHEVPVIGVILNRVLPHKRDMVVTYMEKALRRFDLPILGCIPFDPFLSNPSMKDFEQLFQTTLLTGQEHHLRHFKHTRFVATSVDLYHDVIVPNQLVIIPAEREDIILATIERHFQIKMAPHPQDLETGFILTGSTPPDQIVIEQLKKASIPMLYAPVSSYTAMKMITSYTAKIRQEDLAKVHEAIEIVESHLDFDKLHSALKL